MTAAPRHDDGRDAQALAFEASRACRRAGMGWNKHDDAFMCSLVGAAAKSGVPSVLHKWGAHEVRFDFVPMVVQLRRVEQVQTAPAPSAAEPEATRDGDDDVEMQSDQPDQAGRPARDAGAVAADGEQPAQTSDAARAELDRLRKTAATKRDAKKRQRQNKKERAWKQRAEAEAAAAASASAPAAPAGFSFGSPPGLITAATTFTFGAETAAADGGGPSGSGHRLEVPLFNSSRDGLAGLPCLMELEKAHTAVVGRITQEMTDQSRATADGSASVVERTAFFPKTSQRLNLMLLGAASIGAMMSQEQLGTRISEAITAGGGLTQERFVALLHELATPVVGAPPGRVPYSVPQNYEHESDDYSGSDD